MDWPKKWKCKVWNATWSYILMFKLCAYCLKTKTTGASHQAWWHMPIVLPGITNGSRRREFKTDCGVWGQPKPPKRTRKRGKYTRLFLVLYEWNALLRHLMFNAQWSVLKHTCRKLAQIPACTNTSRFLTLMLIYGPGAHGLWWSTLCQLDRIQNH